jgi:hypothetical protein
MGAESSRPILEPVGQVWSCNDLIHEIMDWVGLKTISSISRIHTKSSTAIFSYHFKGYHTCKYDSFTNKIQDYILLYNKRQYIRPSNGDNLMRLNFYSITIKSSSLKTELYYWPCLYSCLKLTLDIAIFRKMKELWYRAGIKSMMNILMITKATGSSSSNELELRSIQGTNITFPYIRHLRVPNIVIYQEMMDLPLDELTIDSLNRPNINPKFPSTLKVLGIHLLNTETSVNLSGLPLLETLTINQIQNPGLHGVRRHGFVFPPFFLSNELTNSPNTTWFSRHCINDEYEMPFYINNLNRFKSGNNELYLWGLNSPGWQEVNQELRQITIELTPSFTPLATGKYYENCFPLQRYGKNAMIRSINIEPNEDIYNAQIWTNDYKLFEVDKSGEPVMDFHVGLAYCEDISSDPDKGTYSPQSFYQNNMRYPRIITLSN